MGDGGQKDIKRLGISQGLVPDHLLQNLLGTLVKMVSWALPEALNSSLGETQESTF